MIKSLEIENFKSIQKQKVELGNLNVLIGPNGAGKSNFVSLFGFLKKLGECQLEKHVFDSGGIENFLFQGFEKSDSIEIGVGFLEHGSGHTFEVFYGLKIISDGEKYQIAHEAYGREKATAKEYKNGGTETSELAHAIGTGELVQDYPGEKAYTIDTLRVYHFQDTSAKAQIKLPQPIEDVYHFKPEGENLAPFLLFLKENNFDTYFHIVETVRLVFPLFHDFALEESPHAKGKVMLRWKEKGSGQIYTAKQISDGTLRFICLATLLLQPAGSRQVPHTIILDEPELGLHPFAITILAELVQKAAMEKQVILATQSVSLINHFMPKDLLITERNRDGATEFKRLQDEDFQKWLEDYSLGQLWESNFFGGRP